MTVGLLLLAAIVIASVTDDGAWREAPPDTVPWWVLAALFAAAELGRSRRLTQRAVLPPVGARIPLLLGFAFVAPLTVLAAQLLGTSIGLAARWPQERTAVVRAVAGSGLVTAAGLIAFVALAAAPPTSVLDSWLDSGVALVVVAAMARVGTPALVPVRRPGQRPRADGSWSAELAAVAVGLGAVALIGLHRAGIGLVVAGAAAAAASAWHADRAARRSDALERFHGLVGELEWAPDRTAVLRDALEEVRRMSSSVAATLTLHAAEGSTRLQAGPPPAAAPRAPRHLAIRLEANGTVLGHLVLERARWQPSYTSADRDVVGLVSSCLVGSLRIVDRLAELERGHAREQRRSAALDRVNHELRRSEEAKSLSLSVTSHELRAPLTALLAEAELLPHLIDDPGQREVVDRVLRDVGGNARLLLRLVDDLVELARLESGQVRLQMRTVDLQELIGEIAAPFEVPAAAAGTSLEIDAPYPVIVTVDPDRVRQVVSNLLDNARRVTGGGDTIRVVLRLIDGSVTLAIEDSGPGIEPDDLRRIFEPFERGDPSGRGGLGLGLAIARQLVVRHGGDLSATSRPGAGSTFLVTFPRTVSHDDNRGYRGSVEAGPDHAQQPIAG